MAVSKRLRFEVFKRDGFKCQYCGRTPPAIILEPDHIMPVSVGGPDEMGNLVTACFDCNRGKSNVLLTSVPKPLSEVMDEGIEKHEQMEAYNQFLTEKRLTEDERIESIGERWFDLLKPSRSRKKWVFGSARQTSIRRFVAQLPFSRVEEAFEIAQRINATFNDDEKRWRYFCGVCWNMIRAAEGK